MNQNAFQPGNHMPPFPTGAFPPGLPPQTPGGQIVAFPPHIPHPMATAAAAAAAAAAALSNRDGGGEPKEEQVRTNASLSRILCGLPSLPKINII